MQHPTGLDDVACTLSSYSERIAQRQKTNLRTIRTELSKSALSFSALARGLRAAENSRLTRGI